MTTNASRSRRLATIVWPFVRVVLLLALTWIGGSRIVNAQTVDREDRGGVETDVGRGITWSPDLAVYLVPRPAMELLVSAAEVEPLLREEIEALQATQRADLILRLTMEHRIEGLTEQLDVAAQERENERERGDEFEAGYLAQKRSAAFWKQVGLISGGLTLSTGLTLAMVILATN